MKWVDEDKILHQLQFEYGGRRRASELPTVSDQQPFYVSKTPSSKHDLYTHTLHMRCLANLPVGRSK